MDGTQGPPVWLLDVDGVVNAIAGKGDPNVWPRATWRQSVVEDVQVLWSEVVADYLRSVHQRGLAEIRWHTTWQLNAPEQLAPAVGLPEWPIAESPEWLRLSGDGRRWWKTPAADRVVHAEGRRLIWTDDDIASEMRWPGSEIHDALLGGDVLTVSPPSAVGLTRRNLRAIDAFLGVALLPEIIWSPASVA